MELKETYTWFFVEDQTNESGSRKVTPIQAVGIITAAGEKYAEICDNTKETSGIVFWYNPAHYTGDNGPAGTYTTAVDDSGKVSVHFSSRISRFLETFVRDVSESFR